MYENSFIIQIDCVWQQNWNLFFRDDTPRASLRSVSFHRFDFVLRYFLFNDFLLLFAMCKLNALIRYNDDFTCCCSYWCISSTQLQIKFERWITLNFVFVYDRTPFSFFIIYFVIICIQKRIRIATNERRNERDW